MRNGNRGITIGIGGINIGFCADASITKWGIVRRQYRNFIVRSKPDVLVSIKKAPAVLPGIQTRLVTTNSWVLGKSNRNWIIYFYQKDRSCSAAVIDPAFKKIDFFTGNNDLVPVMHNLPIFIFLLAQKKFELFVLHACGVIDKKKGYLFVASSGGGKSTMARLSKGKTVLNDDRIILRKVGSGFKIFGTPWPGEVGSVSNRSVRIKNIFFLRKSKAMQVIPLNRVEAVKELFRNIFFFPINDGMFNAIFSICNEAASKLKCWQLFFRDEISVWKKLKKIN